MFTYFFLAVAALFLAGKSLLLRRQKQQYLTEGEMDRLFLAMLNKEADADEQKARHSI